MTRLTRRQFMLGSAGVAASAVLAALALSRSGPPRPAPVPTPASPSPSGVSGTAGAAPPSPGPAQPPLRLSLVDHYNLRNVRGPAEAEREVAQIKRNLDQAGRYGFDTYVLFAHETFEAMLTYDFELPGLGQLGAALPAGGKHRARAAWLRTALSDVLAHARALNLRVLFHTNQFDFPDEVYDLVGERVQGAGGQPLCPGREDTWRIYRAKLQEFLGLFPDLAGLQVTGDESEYPITVCRCQWCESLSPLDRVRKLTQVTAEAAGGREVQMRTWQTMPELNVYPTALMTQDLPPQTLVSLKEVWGDFLLDSPFEDRLIGAGDPARQIVEFDAWREYDGHNYIPSYLGEYWGDRVRTCRERGIRRFAIRLNWTTDDNPLFERPWGNLVNLSVWLALLQTPAPTPAEALRQFVRTTFPSGPSQEALVQFYQWTPEFQRAIYYADGVYLAHHSRLPRHPDMAREMYATVAPILRTPTDFERRRREVTAAYDNLVGRLRGLGEAVPLAWREQMGRDARVAWLTGMGLADVYQAVSEHRADPALRARILENDRAWQDLDAASYEHMRGHLPRLALDS